MEGGPLEAREVAQFLERGFHGAQRCLAAPGGLPPPRLPGCHMLARRSLTAGAARGAELERMNSSYDSLFEGHMDGAVTGHPGLVQTSISNAVRRPFPRVPRPWPGACTAATCSLPAGGARTRG